MGVCLLCTSPDLRLADSSRTLTWPHDPRTPRLQRALPPGPQSCPDRIPPDTRFQGNTAKQSGGREGVYCSATTARTPAPISCQGPPWTDLVQGSLRTLGNAPCPARALSSYPWDVAPAHRGPGLGSSQDCPSCVGSGNPSTPLLLLLF